MTSRAPARSADRPIRPRKGRIAGLLVAVVALVVVLGHRPASSPPSAASTSSTASSPPARAPSRTTAPAPAPQAGRGGGADAPRGTDRSQALGEAGGAIPDGTTIFDDGVPGVANLDPSFLAVLRRAATDARAAGVTFVVDSGWRSRAYQQHLLDDAIAQYGSASEAARWVASPDTSEHVKGEAIDLGRDAAAWLSEHGAAYGLCRVYANESWHFERRPDAVSDGCPPLYADPTQDPRMHR